MASEEKSIKVIGFTGNNFKIWGRKFFARASRKDYNELLEGKRIIPTKTEYGAAEGEKDDT